MNSYKLVIPGEAPVKKNARKEAYTRKDKNTGLYKALSFPISYYSAEYNEWAWRAVQYLRAWRYNKMGWLPGTWLTGEYFCTIWFFRSTSINLTGAKGKGVGQTIDLQNLYDSILDCLAGNSGLKIPQKLQMDHEDYKIISDDSFAFIKNHGASHIFMNPTHPRTEIYLSPFKLEKLVEIFKLIHPDLELFKVPEIIQESDFPFVEKEKRVTKDTPIDINLNDLFNQ